MAFCIAAVSIIIPFPTALYGACVTSITHSGMSEVLAATNLLPSSSSFTLIAFTSNVWSVKGLRFFTVYPIFVVAHKNLPLS